MAQMPFFVGVCFTRMSTNFCSLCKCDWIHSALLCLLLCQFVKCAIHFAPVFTSSVLMPFLFSKPLSFWNEISRWTDLTVSTRRRPSATCYSEQCSICNSLLKWSSVVNDLVQRVVVSVSTSALSKTPTSMNAIYRVVSAGPSSGVPWTRCKTARRECVATSLRI